MACPEPLVELQLAERSGWQIMPTGLHPGAYDDQPAADLTFWLGVMSLEASTREQFEAKRQRQSKPKMRRR